MRIISESSALLPPIPQKNQTLSAVLYWTIRSYDSAVLYPESKGKAQAQDN
jgi:hypothetical protein